MGVRVRQKVKGKGQPWWVFVAHNKQRTSIKVGTKKAAEAVADEVSAELKLGKFDMNRQKKILTFKDYADTWIKVTVPAGCKDTTKDDYQSILDNHVLDEFGEIPVNEITRGKIKGFLRKKTNDGYSGSTVKHFRAVISGVLNDALDDEKILANPALNMKGIVKKKPANDAINPLSAKEVSSFLEAILEEYTRWYPLFLLLARTGLRIGEAIALTWDDIDFSKRHIHVQRSYVKGDISYPKSGKDRRVDMTHQLGKTLKELKREFKLKVVDDEKPDPGYIFKNKKGGFVDINNLRNRVFHKAIKKAKITDVRIHDLRHTYATLRISKGDNIADVSKQLGHHSVKLTLDTYYHWMPGEKKSEVDALDNLSPVLSNAPSVHPANEKGAANVG